MNITKGAQPSGKKVVIYGVEGIGKSTLASKFPNPLFIDTEGSTKYMDVARFDGTNTWEDVLLQVQYVLANPSCCQTLVIDTADWAEKLMVESLCKKYGADGIEAIAGGYGKGYTYAAESFAKLLSMLELFVKKNVHVLLTAHSFLRRVELPEETGSFDKYEMKLSKKCAPLLKEWADVLLFCNYRTYVEKVSNGKNKASGNKRVIYTTHSAVWDAKNRFGLPECIDMDYSQIAHIFGNQPAMPTAVERLTELMERNGITAEELQKIVALKEKAHKWAYSADDDYRLYAPEFIEGWCIKYFSNIKELIMKEREASK